MVDKGFRPPRVREQVLNKYINNYTRLPDTPKQITHAVLMIAGGFENTKTACGAWQSPGGGIDRYPLTPAKIHGITCLVCKRTINSMLRNKTLINRDGMPFVGSSGRFIEEEERNEVLLSRLGGKMVIALFDDGGVEIADNIAALLEEKGECLNNIIVVDQFREFDIVKKTSYVLEQAD